MKIEEFTKEELNEAFKEALNDLNAPQTLLSSINPKCYILGGQPASGKSKLNVFVKANLDSSFFEINNDDYRKYHPRFEAIEKAYGKESSLYTQAFASAISQNLEAYAIENRFNILMEGTMRTYEVPKATADKMRQNGYKVHALVLCAKKEQSYVGVYSRYEDALARGDNARFTVISSHDEAYTNMPSNIDKLVINKDIDKLTILNYGCEKVLYENKLSNNNWEVNKKPSIAIIEERNRPMSQEEKTNIKQRWESVFDQIKNRNETDQTYISFAKQQLQKLDKSQSKGI